MIKYLIVLLFMIKNSMAYEESSYKIMQQGDNFEVRFYDNTINPEEVIDFKNKVLRGPNLFLHNTLFRPGVTPSQQWKTNSSGKKQYVEKKYYKVRSGDTLSRIAEKHKTSISRICGLNGIRSTSILRIGQNLRVR